MPWYNGPFKGGRVAIVGGPYKTRKLAIEQLFSDSCFASKHWPWTWFDQWYAVKLPADKQRITARRAIADNVGPVCNVGFQTGVQHAPNSNSRAP